MQIPDVPASASVLIVGAGTAGRATAVALRRDGHHGPLTLLDADTDDPVDRPTCPAEFIGAAASTPRADPFVDARLRLGARAVSLDPARRAVLTSTGEVVAADSVVIATGTRPRRLPGVGAVDGVHVLGTERDARALRSEIAWIRDPLVVIGSGRRGTEIAAAAASLGIETVLVGPVPAQRPGVRCVTGRATRIRSVGGRAAAVILDDGRTIGARNVVLAIGTVPNTEWLADSGLPTRQGVRCDDQGRVAPGVWVVGSVAHHETAVRVA